MKKLLSRKWLTALVGVLVGFGFAIGLDAEAISTIAGAVVSVISVVTYIVTEGRIDAVAIGNAAQQVQDSVDKIKEVK